MINQYEPLLSLKDRQSVKDYISRDVWLTEFTETRKLESMIAEFLGVNHCSIVNNGTISLSLALMAGGVRKGDNVIVPNLTMLATATAVSFIGANPILVDVNSLDLTLDIELVKKAIKRDKIKALIYVTLNGRSQHSVELFKFCKDNNIFYISDDAQSLGSKVSTGQKIGSIASISSFSFSMPKIITTGQGGCLVTNNHNLHKEIQNLRDFGREKAGVDNHPYFGINSKFTDLQAVVGISQMEDIEDKIERKKNIFHQYNYLLGDLREVDFLPTFLTYTTPWFVDIYVEQRDKLANFLKKEGIGTRPVYPPVHTQSIYKSYKYDFSKTYPVSIEYSRKGLWLPSSLTLFSDNIEMICKKIREYYKG